MTSSPTERSLASIPELPEPTTCSSPSESRTSRGSSDIEYQTTLMEYWIPYDDPVQEIKHIDNEILYLEGLCEVLHEKWYFFGKKKHTMLLLRNQRDIEVLQRKRLQLELELL